MRARRDQLLVVLADAFEAAGEPVDFAAWEFEQLSRVAQNPGAVMWLLDALSSPECFVCGHDGFHGRLCPLAHARRELLGATEVARQVATSHSAAIADLARRHRLARAGIVGAESENWTDAQVEAALRRRGRRPRAP